MPVPPDAVEFILEQLTRRLDETASRLEDGLGRMDGVYVRKDVYQQAVETARSERDAVKVAALNAAAEVKNDLDDLESRLRRMEDARQWLFRMASGAFVTALISMVVVLVQQIGTKQ